MAGICGVIGLVPVAYDEAVLDGMIKRLAHRGREVRRVRWREIAFATLDEHPPCIWPPPGRESRLDPCVILHGNLDNAAELASELAREGRQAGPNEASLLGVGVQAHGPEFFRRVQGCYAAAVHNPETATTWLFRDPVGMRPLYLHRTHSRILFASEIRALLADPLVRLEMEPAQLRVLLSLGFNPAPNTLLKRIHKMPPGHFIEATQTNVRVDRFDPVVAPAENDMAFDEAVDGYRSVLSRVVRRSREEKLGVLLSGGADSAALLLLGSKAGKDPATFTVGFSGLDGHADERPAAWQAARALGSVHREKTIAGEEIPALFAGIARICEEPTIGAWTPPFLRLIESAQGQVPALWSGQGTGTLHGEDPIWRWIRWGGLINTLPSILGVAARKIGGQVARLASAPAGAGMLSAHEVRERVLSAFFLFDDPALDGLLRAGHMGDRELVRKLLDRWREPVRDRDPLFQGLYIGARTLLPDTVLLPAERIAAEHGIVVRFPYADPEVVHYLESVPSAYRVGGAHGKRLHREALTQWLPAGVLSRPKVDLGVAVRRWLRGEGVERVSDWLLGPTAWLPSVLDGVRVRRLIDHTANRRSAADPLLLLVHLELWARETFLGGAR